MFNVYKVLNDTNTIISLEERVGSRSSGRNTSHVPMQPPSACKAVTVLGNGNLFNTTLLLSVSEKLRKNQSRIQIVHELGVSRARRREANEWRGL
jgi:hypothetical protein